MTEQSKEPNKCPTEAHTRTWLKSSSLKRNIKHPSLHAYPLLYALNKRMDLLLDETYDNVYQRHLEMAKYTQQWAKKHFEMFPEPGYESITVSCIKNTLRQKR